MKKIIAIIIILAIILGGMYVYKNNVINRNNITIQEIEKIESYMEQIYMWKEITKDALPCFEEINQADETWIWEVVKKNLEEYEIPISQIQEKAKEIFGGKFSKEFPKEGTKYITFNEENNLYYATGIELDQQADSFLLDKIEKTKQGYEVEIIEYLEDYSSLVGEEQKNYATIRNLEQEEIGKINPTNTEEETEFIKQNKNRFSKKKIILRLENEKLYVEKVYQE
ncbi:MAG: hypothetical protein HFJ34_01600 [Clostridia bacterium]|nr:hypothetical protein [Clostridia bacterium]